MDDDIGQPNDERPSEIRPDSTDFDDSPPVDVLLELVAHQHRRDLLRYLIRSTDTPTAIDEVTTHLLERYAEGTSEQPDRDQLELLLHHIHLPKLTAAGIIEYDSRSNELRYRRHDRLETLLDCLDAADLT
ncbi:hypothetical protein [Natrinema sp. HArc-T2]|uniref:DUF7344 domain-containing protein n=1 Tax=Natrinema sp. HArc-T2 TaxID=3242701 RepID=UPI00359CCAD6